MRGDLYELAVEAKKRKNVSDMNKIVDITGAQYNMLYVLGFSHIDKHRKSYWICRCDCGNIVTLRKSSFAYKYSRQKSCGCLHRKQSSDRLLKYHENRKLFAELKKKYKVQ